MTFIKKEGFKSNPDCEFVGETLIQVYKIKVQTMSCPLVDGGISRYGGTLTRGSMRKAWFKSACVVCFQRLTSRAGTQTPWWTTRTTNSQSDAAVDQEEEVRFTKIIFQKNKTNKKSHNNNINNNNNTSCIKTTSVLSFRGNETVATE